jgi:hypothetical protein
LKASLTYIDQRDGSIVSGLKTLLEAGNPLPSSR